MFKITGIKNGAVLQRDDNGFCSVTLIADFCGKPKSSLGELTEIGKNKWRLTGIHVGGPYTITVQDDKDSMQFTDIYVGDLWLLAGQSNMEGAGRMTPEDDYEASNSKHFIRAFYMDDTWGAAKPILHHLNLSEDAAHKETWKRNMESLKQRGIEVWDNPPYEFRRGVGPGLYFAKEMFRLTDGIVQGVIPAAVGAAPIEMWLPAEEGENNYYTAACRRIKETGNNIKGVFWAQGEGNANANIYPSQIEKIRADLCKRLDIEQIPFVQMQSFKCTLHTDNSGEIIWSRFREMQRKMPVDTTMLATIATNDLELDDCIHLSSASQKIAGVRAARAMNYLITGRGHPEPMLDAIYAVKDRYVPSFSEIHIRYKNVSGELKSSGVPFGFTMKKTDSDDAPSMAAFRKLLPAQNEVIIYIERPIEELFAYELWYGYGNNFYCNITDGENRAIPAMGPIALKDYL